MEMEPWLQTLLTILGTILASSGFWAYIQERSKRKAAENKHNNLETQLLTPWSVRIPASLYALSLLRKSQRLWLVTTSLTTL